MNISDGTGEGKASQPRRRNARPEQANLFIERVERLDLHIEGGSVLSRLLESFERRITVIEEATPSIGMVASQSGRLSRLEEVVRVNGNGTHGR
jgi:hypothetical protein